MPHCHERKIFWFTPAKTASRTVAEILKKLNFQNVRSHYYYENAKEEGFFVIWNVRSPFTRLVSLYNLSCQQHGETRTFDVWLKTKFIYDSTIEINSKMLNVYKKDDKPDYLVKQEKLKNDLLSLEFIKKNFDEKTNRVFDVDLENKKYFLEIPNNKKWYEFYNEELASFVCKNLEHEFEMFDYNINYWKDGTP